MICSSRPNNNNEICGRIGTSCESDAGSRMARPGEQPSRGGERGLGFYPQMSGSASDYEEHDV